MPLYDFKCNSCGTVFDSFVQVNGPTPDCVCGGHSTKVFNLQCQFNFDRKFNPEFDDLRAKHNAWLQSDETQGKLKRGELRHLTREEQTEDVH